MPTTTSQYVNLRLVLSLQIWIRFILILSTWEEKQTVKYVLPELRQYPSFNRLASSIVPHFPSNILCYDFSAQYRTRHVLAQKSILLWMPRRNTMLIKSIQYTSSPWVGLKHIYHFKLCSRCCCRYRSLRYLESKAIGIYHVMKARSTIHWFDEFIHSLMLQLRKNFIQPEPGEAHGPKLAKQAYALLNLPSLVISPWSNRVVFGASGFGGVSRIWKRW